MIIIIIIKKKKLLGETNARLNILKHNREASHSNNAKQMGGELFDTRIEVTTKFIYET
jgi:hypothetical protein